MSFWDELMAPAGRVERVENFFYDSIHYHFGLPKRYHLQDRKVYQLVKLKWSGNMIKSFEVTGRDLVVDLFTSNQRHNLFTRIDRDFELPRDTRYAYDLSRISQGTLSARWAKEGSRELDESDARRVLLDLIGAGFTGRLMSVPVVYVELGPVWFKTGVPDRIYVQLDAMDPIRQTYLDRLVRIFLNHYRIAGNDEVEPTIYTNPATSEIDITVAENIQENFPYDYYKSIGLIDNEGMVLVDTLLGKMSISAYSDEGRRFLLEYGLNNSTQQ